MIKEKFTDLKVRGLKINTIDKVSKMQFVDAEFLAATEAGLVSFNRFMKYLATKGQMIVFTRLHIAGDKLLKPTGDIEVGSEGTQAIATLFIEGSLPNLIEFRFTDFCVEPFSMLGIAQSLCMNPSLMMIDFSRDNIDEDLATGIIQ